jgi:streptomycin 6-kinase
LDASIDPNFPAGWKLRSPKLIAETFSSRVWSVARNDGSLAVVKALKDFPDVWDELRGAYLLQWLEGRGMVRLYACEARMMLLEHAGTRMLTDVIDTQGDSTATEIAADVLARMMHSSEKPVPTELQPLRERYRSLFAKAKAEQNGGLDSLYVEAAELAERLLTGERERRPLHGDLHHENILQAPRGWLAIDPKGLIGDPGYDAANMFYNPLDREELCRDENRIAFMAETFGATLGQSPRTILQHGIAYGCLSSSWHAEDGNTEEEARELGIAQALKKVALSF